MIFRRLDQVDAFKNLHFFSIELSFHFILLNVVGAIRACFVCAEILKETKNKALTAEKFSSLLGIPTSSKQPPQKEKGHDKGNPHLEIIFNTKMLCSFE